ncbi:related to EXG1-exo-beta-1,3-glucanase (I/II), major isoform [Serendipita indica DSM 11827]|uniref:glucan 1,3-beta-glucosidase n=1 Tax=Serendipita indica (strain DSM 11827) TaxID=1109443 RepID=G4TQG9_SERID|nr:related to EXG1-exo-beta-1,3-glucanase (I/II), major isoform [Serendipita indica DSM 11827]
MSQSQHSSVPYGPIVSADDHEMREVSSRTATPLPAGAYLPPNPHSTSYLTPYHDNPSNAEFGAPNPAFLGEAGTRSSYGQASTARSSAYGSIAPLHDHRGSAYVDEPSGWSAAPKRSIDLRDKQELYEAPRRKSKKKIVFWALTALALAIIAAAVVIPVYIFVIKKKDNSGGGSGSNSGHSNTGHGGNNNNNNNNNQDTTVTWGGDGSIVTKEDGSTFRYNNTHGGYWVFDPKNPLNNSARAQSTTPSLAEPWKWGEDQIFGVNLGGWFTLEPFISPALYEPFYPNAVDEWTLSTLLQQRDGNLNVIEEHYKTFIVEEDFAMIAAAGLNWVRIPLPFWAIETYPGEPFLARTCWTYFLKAIEWARKYGIRINLDLHAVPGSQNGWNHSGKMGQVNFLNGVMGLANAQRTLDYIRILAEFISQPEYANIIQYFGIINEPGSGTGNYPKSAIESFYAEAYKIIRGIGGNGNGNGPVISIHEAFYGLGGWTDFLPGADRLALDQHTYLVFGPLINQPPAAFPAIACTQWSAATAASMSAFGQTGAGEWSLAINDCGLYLNTVGGGTRYEGTFDGQPRIGSCAPWQDYATWDQSIKDALRNLALASMDSLQDSFFWTWRIGESRASGKVETPFWSYKLAVQEGWAPANPRDSRGYCASIGAPANTFSGAYTPAQVGGPGAGTAVQGLDSYPWPPTAIGGYPSVAGLPTYTATGALSTLPVPTFASATASVGDGWTNNADTTPMAVPVAGCTYPDPWNALTAAIPACGVFAKRDGDAPAPTAAPKHVSTH